MRYRNGGLAILTAALAIASPAWAEEVEREAVIVSHSENNLSVRTREGNLTVVLTPATTIREVSGALGGTRRTRPATTLIPGLIIKVEGDQQGETVTATRVEFRERDWRAAIASRAGTTEQFAQAAAERTELRNAIIDGQEYVVREETTVYFASGSAAIAAQYGQQLRQLAQNAPGFGNYRVSVIGYADPRGNAAANERLSQRRALAVRNFLAQTGSIQPGRILGPAAMGEGASTPGETPPATDAEARRVVVRVVTARTQLQR